MALGGDENLNIIVRLRDEASKEIASLQDRVKSFQDRIEPAADASRKFALGLAAVGTAAGAFGLSMIKAAAGAEQTQIAFTTMLGSAEKAGSFYKDLVAFAAKTPFNLTGLEQASKQLLAYGFAQEEVLPNLRSLGDIASGVGMDKLPNLILAFGQVKAATKLTGMELRQFTEAGVPLLQALTDQMNKTGGMMTTVGETSKKTAKEINGLNDKSSQYRSQVESLNDTLVKQNNRLSEMQSKGKITSASYKNLQIDIQNTKDKIQNLTSKISDNNSKLSELGPISAGVSKSMQYTVKDIQQMVSDGKIGFDQVQKALSSLTQEGGRFNDLMTKQSESLGGMWSNLQDSWESFLRGEGAQLINWAKQFVAAITVFVNDTLPKWIEKIKQLTDWLGKHKVVLYIVAGVIIGGLVPAVIAAAAAFATWAIALAPFLIGGAIVGALVAGIVWIVKNWDMIKQKANEIWSSIADFFRGIWESITGAIEVAWNAIKDFFNTIWDAIKTVFKFQLALVTGLVIAVFDALGIDIVAVFERIGQFFVDAWNAIKETFTTAGNEISTMWSNTWNSISDFVTRVWESIKTAAQAGWNWLVTKFKEFTDPITKAWNTMWDGLTSSVKGAWEGVKNIVKDSVNWIIEKVNKLINSINEIARKGAGVVGFDAPQIPTIPLLANGGIVNKPTLAVIGEAGPEAVVPLSRAGSFGMGGGVNVTINYPEFKGPEDEARLKRALDDYFRPLLINHKLTA